MNRLSKALLTTKKPHLNKFALIGMSVPSLEKRYMLVVPTINDYSFINIPYAMMMTKSYQELKHEVIGRASEKISRFYKSEIYPVGEDHYGNDQVELKFFEEPEELEAYFK